MLEFTILEADISTTNQSLFEKKDTIQATISKQASEVNPKHVTNHASNISYHNNEVKNMFWNETFVMDLEEAQGQSLYLNLIKNYTKDQTYADVAAYTEAIDIN